MDVGGMIKPGGEPKCSCMDVGGMIKPNRDATFQCHWKHMGSWVVTKTNSLLQGFPKSKQRVFNVQGAWQSPQREAQLTLADFNLHGENKLHLMSW